jgi:hypothetical protein
VGSFRPIEPSTSCTSPSTPFSTRARAWAHTTELVRWEPIWTSRPLFWAAATMSKPSATLCDIGFSQ